MTLSADLSTSVLSGSIIVCVFSVLLCPLCIVLFKWQSTHGTVIVFYASVCSYPSVCVVTCHW